MNPPKDGAGLYREVALEDYLEIDAIGSTRLEWLNVSPLHYRYMLGQPDAETEATRRGSALHMALLEPELFAARYAVEPDPESVAPGAAKPRATNAYKDAVAELEAKGVRVFKADAMSEILAMVASIKGHPHAARLLERAREREVTALWDRNGRPCRARLDLLGDGIAADVKTTRSLRGFSPWTITKLGYYRQAGWYVDGLKRLGHAVKHFFLVAVESTPPHDVGVFVLDSEMVDVGRVECDALLKKLDLAEQTGEWPGMFPEIQQAMLTDAITLQVANAEVDD